MSVKLLSSRATRSGFSLSSRAKQSAVEGSWPVPLHSKSKRDIAIGRASLAALAALLIIAGCNGKPAPAQTTPAVTGGLFQVVRQGAKQPTVVVDNKSDAHLRLLLNRDDGTSLKLDVGPNSSGTIKVPTGHYEAKVLDTDGRIDSAYGSADIGEYYSYRAAFKVYHDEAEHKFHIGDELSPLKKTY